MKSNRFRLRVTQLETRDNPASLADALVAADRAEYADFKLQLLAEKLDYPWSQTDIAYFKSYYADMSDISAADATNIANALAEIRAMMAGDPGSVVTLSPIADKLARGTELAQKNAIYAETYATGWGAPNYIQREQGRHPAPAAPTTPAVDPNDAINKAKDLLNNSNNTTTNNTTTNNTTTNSDGTTTTDNTGNTTTDTTNTGTTLTPPGGPLSTTDSSGMSTSIPDINDPHWTTTASGLKIWDVNIGSGNAAVAHGTVEVYYSGWLLNGTQFDSNRTSTPINFPLDNLIKGWQEGIPGMKPGGLRRLYVPYALGYGESGGGSIPGKADLVFEIKLLSSS